MAGRGSRFKQVGVDKPKHEIPVYDRPMFDWAMQSLEQFFDREFVFVTQSEHAATEFLSRACERLGIDTYREITLDEYTSGQATTAIEADDAIDDTESVAIYNIDTYIEEGEITPADISGDGFIPVFEAPGERWSFVKESAAGEVTEVSEKEKISDLATAGFYFFDRWSDFVRAYNATASRVETEYGETYVAPLYNYLIQDGQSVTTYHISPEAVHVLGTPEDLQEFYPEFEVERK
jgi:dTDP-glucose pyrophosphorylase